MPDSSKIFVSIFACKRAKTARLGGRLIGSKSFGLMLGACLLFEFTELRADSLFRERKRVLADAPIPKDLWLKTIRESKNFRISYKATKDRAIKAAEPLELEISVEPNEGIRLVNLKFDAEMPKHMHGLGYKPKISEVPAQSGSLDNFKKKETKIYLLKHLVFHMQGWWKMTVILDFVTGDSRTETERIEFDLMIF